VPVTVVHQTTATQPDSGDGKISSNAWNEEHTLTGFGTMAEGDAADYYTAAEVDAAIADGSSWGGDIDGGTPTSGPAVLAIDGGAP